MVIGTACWFRRAARGSAHLTDERADRFADVGVVPQEPVAAAFDAYEPSSGDAVCGLGREPIGREGGVVPGVDDQRGDGQLLEGNRSAARLEVKPSKTAPARLGFRGKIMSAIAAASRGEGRYPFGLPIIREYAPGMTFRKIQKRRSAL